MKISVRLEMPRSERYHNISNIIRATSLDPLHQAEFFAHLSPEDDLRKFITDDTKTISRYSA